MPGTKLKVVSNPLKRGGLAIIHLKEVEDEDLRKDDDGAEGIKTKVRSRYRMTMASPFNFNVYLFFNQNKCFQEASFEKPLLTKQLPDVQLPKNYRHCFVSLYRRK
jgi:hypothetical protein